MKKTTVLSIVGAALAELACAAPLVYESFEQAAPGELAGQNTGTGFSDAYFDNDDYCTVVLDAANRLVYQGGDLTVDGGSTFMRMQPTVVKDLLTWGRGFPTLAAPAGGGPLYISFLFRVSASVADDADEDQVFFGVTERTTNDPYLGLHIAKHESGSGNAIGLRFNNKTGLVTGCPKIQGGRTYLLVFRWYPISGTWRGIDLIVNPTTATEPAASDWTVIKDSEFKKKLSDYRAFTCKVTRSCETDDAFEFDEIRIGDSWAEVTSAPTYNGVVPRPSISATDDGASRTVTISHPVAGCSCYYTTDGTTPSAQNGTLYTAPFVLSASTTIKAVAVDAGGNESEVVAAAVNLVAHWTGAGADDNWLTSGNWLPAASPANKSLVFGAEDRVVSGSINNVLATDMTIRSLVYTNNNTTQATSGNAYCHVTKIEENATLTIDSVDDDGYAMRLFAPQSTGKNMFVWVEFTGGGALEVDSPDGIFEMRHTSGNNTANSRLYLDGLSSFECSVREMRLWPGLRSSGVLSLPKTGRGYTRIVTPELSVGNTYNKGQGGNNASVWLGTENDFRVDWFGIGSSHPGVQNNAQSTIAFNSGLVNPTFTLRAADGVGRADLLIGVNGGASINYETSNAVDLSGGTADARIDRLVVGDAHAFYGSGKTGRVAATFSMDGGVVDAADVTVARTSFLSGSRNTDGDAFGTANLCFGTVNVDGGSFIVTNDFKLAENADGGYQSTKGTLNQSAGRVSVGRDFILATRESKAVQVVADVNVSGGELSVAGDLKSGVDTKTYDGNWTEETVNVQANVNALGGVITVTNVAGTSELRLEKGTLTLAGGKVFADNLILTNAASAVSLEIDADYKPVAVTAGGAIKLGGTLHVAPKEGARLSGPYVIASGGAREGRFSAVDLPEGYRVYYGADSVSIGGGATIIMVR